jgi:hypothetical protein
MDKLGADADAMIQKYGSIFKRDYGWASDALGITDVSFAKVSDITGEPIFRAFLSLPGSHGELLTLPHQELFCLRIAAAVLRYSRNNFSAKQLSEIAVFAYLLQHPDFQN